MGIKFKQRKFIIETIFSKQGMAHAKDSIEFTCKQKKVKKDTNGRNETVMFNMQALGYTAHQNGSPFFGKLEQAYRDQFFCMVHWSAFKILTEIYIEHMSPQVVFIKFQNPKCFLLLKNILSK